MKEEWGSQRDPLPRLDLLNSSMGTRIFGGSGYPHFQTDPGVQDLKCVNDARKKNLGPIPIIKAANTTNKIKVVAFGSPLLNWAQ